uniref:MAM domain containing glycosylphosphatidylinositol anchor 1 n=1 Tax=Eptatretus burgeri TaxID=7764 RepID=A0A8C4QZJ9_EPTBU
NSLFISVSAASPQARITHQGQACNYNDEGYSERVYAIREGGTLELSCLVNGHPKPQVRWTKTAGAVQDKKYETTVYNATLRIECIQRLQAGRYYCRADNGIGQPAIKSFRVDVYYLDPPVLTVHQSIGDAKEYYQERTVFLRCSGNSSPPALLTWHRNDRHTLIGDEGVSIYEPLFTQGETKILKLKNLRAQDYAKYSCVASVRQVCGLKDQKASFKLTNRTAAPSIQIRVTDPVIVNPGDLVLLQCEVLGGDPPPRLSWSRVVGELPPDIQVSGGNLTIPRVRLEDAGEFQCSASNNVSGPVRKSISIYVRTLRNGRFWITPDPYHEDDTIKIGREVKISCQVEAVPLEELRFSWLKNGRRLRPSDRIIISKADSELAAGTSSLDIIDLRFTDFGTYTCQAKLANYASPEINIEVNISSSTVPPSVSVPPNRARLRIREGKDAELQCEVHGKPKPVLRWCRIDKDCTDPVETYDGILHLRNVSRTASGVYRCQTSPYNGFNVPPREAQVELEVLYPPPVFPQTLELRQALGRSVSLRCNVERGKGWRPLRYEWRLDGSLLSSARYDAADPNLYEIEKLSNRDYGVYNCSVSNEAGTSSCIFSVNGRAYAPEFYYDTVNPVRSVKPNVYSFLLQWTQKEPEAVDRVTSYRLQYKQIRSGHPRWQGVDVSVPSQIRRGDLLSHTISDLYKPFSYHVRLTPQTLFGDGDSALRLVHYYEAPTLSPQTGDASCSFEDESLCGFRHDPSGNFNWTRRNAEKKNPNTTPNTGPLTDLAGSSKGMLAADVPYSPGGTPAGHYMFIEASRPRKPGDKARLISPIYTLATPSRSGGRQNVFCLFFYYHMYGKHVGSLNVFIRSYGTLGDQPMWSHSNNMGDHWHKANVTITPRGPFQIILEGVRGSGMEGDIAIDDVTVVEGSCAKQSSFYPSPRNSCDMALSHTCCQLYLVALALAYGLMWPR